MQRGHMLLRRSLFLSASVALVSAVSYMVPAFSAEKIVVDAKVVIGKLNTKGARPEDQFIVKYLTSRFKEKLRKSKEFSVVESSSAKRQPQPLFNLVGTFYTGPSFDHDDVWIDVLFVSKKSAQKGATGRGKCPSPFKWPATADGFSSPEFQKSLSAKAIDNALDSAVSQLDVAAPAVKEVTEVFED